MVVTRACDSPSPTRVLRAPKPRSWLRRADAALEAHMLNLWNSLNGFSPFSDEAFAEVLERLSNESMDAPARADTFTPAVDVFEDKDAFVVKAELPGMKVEDVGIDIDKGVLTLHGSRKVDKHDDKDGYRHVERLYGAFTRSFGLPDTVDPEKIQASLSDGILTVRLSKKPSSQPRKINIKVS
jgi:HSP20 family protein